MKKLETLYRVYDVPNKKYYTSNEKNIWKSKAWAITAVQNSNRRNLDFEIHTISQVVDVVESANDLIIQAKELKKEYEIVKGQIEEIEDNLKNDFYNLPISRIKELYNKNKLSDSVVIEVKETFNKLSVLYKKLNDLK